MRRLELSGKKFNHLLAIKDVGVNANQDRLWECLCDCGNIKVAAGRDLKSGQTKSCGCLSHISTSLYHQERNKHILGQKYGRLTVLSYSHSSGDGSIYECICECGNSKRVLYSDIVSGMVKSCGCLGVETREKGFAISHQKGENHPCYKPWITQKERELGRCTPESDTWRRQVFERDDYKCRLCGCKKGGSLRAHHIFSYNKYEHLRYIVNNGVTLCDDCHKNFHKLYGRQDNTFQQLYEFFEQHGIILLLRKPIIRQPIMGVIAC